MKKLFICIFSLTTFFANAQETLTFRDGTTIDVVGADFSVQGIRKLNIGFLAGIDGLNDFRIFNVSYLKPKKFYVGTHFGFANAMAEGIIFLSGKDLVKRKSVPLKSVSGGANTVKVYTTPVELQKRREWGVYVAASDYGSLYNAIGEPALVGQNNIFSKLTVLYAGVAKTGYWSYNVVKEKGNSQGSYLGRMVLAPFYVVNAVKSENADNENYLPSYGARFSYEVTAASKWFTLGAKLGADGFARRGNDPEGRFSKFGASPIVAFGLGICF